MTVSIEKVKDIQIIHVEYKSLDASKVEEFLKKISDDITQNNKNLIDLSKLTYT